MKMNGNKFWSGVVAQHDDEDYSDSGYAMTVIDGVASIWQYSHCSCYGTWTSIAGGGISDYFEGDQEFEVTPVWGGTPDELVSMARRSADPAMPSREIVPDEDYDSDHLLECYKQVIEWDERGRVPLDSGG